MVADAWSHQPTLCGKLVVLRPMTAADTGALWSIGDNDDLWRLSPRLMRSIGDMESYVGEALDERRRGRSMPFVTTQATDGAVVGSTRFGNMDEHNRRVEIGWTWLGADWHRTGFNTEAKLLMLDYAFEQMQCIRVELKTDVLNVRSRTAIQRIGATEEGILRRHVITASGRVRDTIYYSIVSDEWPEVRRRLTDRLRRADADR